MRIVKQSGHVEHIYINGFEYKRVNSVAIAKIFGFTIFKKCGDLSILFGVNWHGYTPARIY